MERENSSYYECIGKILRVPILQERIVSKFRMQIQGEKLLLVSNRNIENIHLESVELFLYDLGSV